MINWLTHYWDNYQLALAIRKGQSSQARALLQKLERSGKKLSCLASLYQQQLQTKTTLNYYRQETSRLQQHLQAIAPQAAFLTPQQEFIDYINRCFQLKQIDSGLIQVTGIESSNFLALETSLVDFVTIELNKVSAAKRDRELSLALADLAGLKQGIDPEYNCRLTPHVYFLKYFLDNVYCLFLAWYLIYQQGLLPQKLKVLDLAAGMGTSIFGLSLLLSSKQQFDRHSTLEVNYYSLELQADLQYRGLQFWRKYVQTCSHPLNTYFQFNTVNLFDYDRYQHQLPPSYFDLIIIAHCFFYELKPRQASNQVYRQIFQQSLNCNGYVLLIIQGKKLFNAYDTPINEDLTIEQQIVQMFVTELGLKLVWYQYLSSTGKRTANKTNFPEFARNNLPVQKHLSKINQVFLQQNYRSHYAIDDYVILAKL